MLRRNIAGLFVRLLVLATLVSALLFTPAVVTPKTVKLLSVLPIVRLSMTRASRVVRRGGSPDTQAALDTVGMSWTSACIACHEAGSNPGAANYRFAKS